MSDLKQQIRSISAEQAGVLYERLQSLAALRESVDEIPILPRQSPLPLSLGQERLWLFDQMYPNTASYNISTVIPVQAGYARELAESWRELLERHEILRTHYPIVQGEVRQLATSAADFELATTDLRKLDETERLTAAQSAASREARTPFDLLRGPVCRARLLHLDEQLDWLLITVHHIATDGWSQQILQRELQQIFSAKVHSRELTLPPLPIQYADFASYQRASSSSAAAREAGNYWRRQLAEAPPVFSLAADRERPALQTFVGATQRFRLSSQTSLRLREVARDSGHTLLDAVAVDPATRIGRMPLLLGSERAFIAEGCQQIPEPVWDRVQDAVTAKNWQRSETGVAVLDRFGHPSIWLLVY